MVRLVQDPVEFGVGEDRGVPPRNALDLARRQPRLRGELADRPGRRLAVAGRRVQQPPVPLRDVGGAPPVGAHSVPHTARRRRRCRGCARHQATATRVPLELPRLVLALPPLLEPTEQRTQPCEARRLGPMAELEIVRQPRLLVLDEATASVDFVDLNNDGFLDIVVGSYFKKIESPGDDGKRACRPLMLPTAVPRIPSFSLSLSLTRARALAPPPPQAAIGRST